jgi:pimeloyl-ACP methyl ester carboxylesterase
MATYVIVHGAGDAGANWDLVAAELRARDHEVVAPDLPADDESAGLSEYADTVVEAIGDRTDLVVVAHSLGGFTAPLVCERVPVALLVLVAGMVPLPGEKAGEWWANTGHAQAFDDRWKDDEIAQFLHDAPPDLAAAALENGRDQAATPMLEPWPLDSWPEVATRYLLCRDDRLHPADWTRQMVRERLGIEADEIDGGHMPYVSRPRELADRLDAYRIETKERQWVSR